MMVRWAGRPGAGDCHATRDGAVRTGSSSVVRREPLTHSPEVRGMAERQPEAWWTMR